MFSVPSYPGENQEELLGEFKSRSVKTRHSWGFSSAWELSQTLLRFSPGYLGMGNIFNLFYKVITEFSDLIQGFWQGAEKKFKLCMIFEANYVGQKVVCQKPCQHRRRQYLKCINYVVLFLSWNCKFS